MAEDFGAENLEDGERWLPSDFFSMDEVQVSNKLSAPFDCCSSSKPSCMEVFQRFPSSAFIQRHPQNRGLYRPLPSLQRFKPEVWYGSSGVSGGRAHDPCECRTRSSWTGCSSIYHLQHTNPVQNQVETFIGERAWDLQRQQRHQFAPNRVFPVMGIGAHGGTGVFLPRVSSNMLSCAVTKKQNNQDIGKGPRLMNSHKFQLPPRMILLNKRKEEGHGSAAEVFMPNNCNY